MLVLGIESTAHTFGIGIVTGSGKILANERSVYKPTLGKGIIPKDAAEHHENDKEMILDKALSKADIPLEDIDIIAYSCGAGLPPCLLVGANFALDLSKKLNKPIIPVCHQIGHIEIGRLTTNAEDPVIVYLSGGNSQVIAYAEGRYRIFGETEDIPLGNALDVFARGISLPMPGGPEIEKLAKSGKYIQLPYVVKGMDLSFSGILTAALNKFKENVNKEDLSFSMQETCFAMLTEVTERALAHTGKSEILLVGGVAANKRLQEMLDRMCEERGAKFYVVPYEYSMDNGVMIAWVGALAHNSGWKQDLEDKIKPAWRTDQVEITWFK
ncbi:MAG: bifunctional N(6)-L-threonylcarbamoyladenine synthase/serine/threonine protein kinase [Candidatus Aenigmarchaeota archaeon]|nr:bifunctional N(6)-L-threonylcarbamoyladenine synthase/serine/threonine protein kinase [Candidatus Aenigmarchaeota archaeon]